MMCHSNSLYKINIMEAKKSLYCISIGKNKLNAPDSQNLSWKQAEKKANQVVRNFSKYASKHGYGAVNIRKQK